MRFLLLTVALALTAVASAVYYGQTRAEVLQELGKPSSDLKRGAREVLIYKAGRIELVDGKVAVVQGIAVSEGPGAAPAIAPEPAPAAEPAPAETARAPEPELAKAEAKPTPAATEKARPQSAEQELLEADAKARAQMEKAIADLENPPRPEDEYTPPPRWIAFVVELIVKALMMLVALWLTTKYWSVEISWFGLAMAALADTVTRAAVGAVALWALGMGSTMYADEATAAIILVVVLRKVSFNQSLQQAVTITLTSKTFSIVVGSFLSVFLMRTLFGSGGGGIMPF